MRFRFVLGQVAKGMGHNFAMTISVILVTFVSLLFVGTGVLTQMQVGKLEEQWYSRVEVSVYMCAKGDVTAQCTGDAASDAEVSAVRARLESAELAPYVSNVEFKTSADAYESFKELYGDTQLGASATEDMLPQSFRVSLKNPNDYDLIDSEVSGMNGVQSVQDQRDIIQPLLTALNRATGITLGLAGVMIVAAVLLITTTIRLSAMARRKETTVMRYVGASNLFIQLPFMIEGALAALIGAILAVGGLWVALHFIVERWIVPAIPYTVFVGVGDLVVVAPILVVAAIVLALIASAVSLAKYTKV